VSGFRGSDETLDREIETLEAIARVRLKRVAREMRDLDRDLRELKRERARRRATSAVPAGPVVEEIPGEGVA
jgi:septal ring factor EnvC (AmiA/AmiB activator)